MRSSVPTVHAAMLDVVEQNDPVGQLMQALLIVAPAAKLYEPEKKRESKSRENRRKTYLAMQMQKGCKNTQVCSI